MAIELDLDDGPARPAQQRSTGIQLSRWERSSFLERLALMLEAGTPLNSALETMGRAGDADSNSHRLARELAVHVSGGGTFHESLGRYPSLLDGVELQLVAAGERGGFLAQVIRKIVDFSNRQSRLRNSIIGALTYPVVLLVISLLVCLFVLMVVFPQFHDMFSKLGEDLPLLSRWLFGLSQWLDQNRLLSLGVAGGTIFLLARWCLSPIGKATMRAALVAMPWTRKVLDDYAIAQLTRVLSLSLAHGVSVTDALNYLLDTFRDPRFGNALADIARQVENGMGIAHGFSRNAVFPDLVKQLVETGEEAGALAEVLEKLADHYETELDRRVAMLGKIAEPVMLVVMGVLVGGLVSALILPIFRMSSTIS